MRWFYAALIVIFVAAIIAFGLQNREAVTVSFLGFSLRSPLAVLATIMYLLGAVTGGSLFGLLRHSVRETKLRWQ